MEGRGWLGARGLEGVVHRVGTEAVSLSFTACTVRTRLLAARAPMPPWPPLRALSFPLL